MNTAPFYQNKALQAVLAIVGLILLLVWMQGGFTAKTPPGTTPAPEAKPAGIGHKAKAELRQIGETMRWPGTVTARSVAQIAPKLPARILDLTVHAGEAVKTGQIVARLEQSEPQSRVSGARSALAVVEAHAAKATADLRRAQNLFDREAATKQSLEAAQAAARSADAQVAEAQANIAAAQSRLGETVLRAPFDGIVVKRTLEPGDMAQPGAPVLTIQSNQKLRVEAAIPESCAQGVAVGASLTAVIGVKTYAVKVEEIAPATDPQTRTVLVKAGFDGSGFDKSSPAQPGAFAWIEQHCGGRTVLVIPAAAVSRSGQLETVRLVEKDSVKLRHIRTGKLEGDQVEVLSGLVAGDVVLTGGGR
jgi:RND family efflux transporter MFP subunit